jgi:16S rRNA (cytidine1402-2'-O)-methyltransferase
MAQPGKLYVCATPIGALEDITLRALRVLREADLIAAEDTRRTRKLLAHYGIHTPLISYHEHNKARQTPRLLDLLRQGRSVALVSDAGTPGISDPGQELIRGAVEQGLPVVAVPGPSALLTALVLSGFPSDRFRYEGFVPRRQPDRRALLESLRHETAPTVLFEAPHRLLQTLSEIAELLGTREVCVCRELTKRFEQVLRGTAAQVRDALGEPRGEITLVIAGAPEARAAQSPEEATGEVMRRLAAGESARDAIREVARESGVPRSVLYAAVHGKATRAGRLGRQV